MHVAAAKIGVGVPAGDFSASVHSVFRNACILAVEGNGLVTIASPAAGGLPAGITLAPPADVDFELWIAPGSGAGARGRILRFAGSSLAVDLRGAEPWRSRLSHLSLDPFAAPVQAAWSIVAELLRADGRAKALAEIAAPAILALADATRRFDLMAAAAAMLRLVGLGAGGTPAGDDFVVGHLAGLWVSSTGDRRRTKFIEAMGHGLAAMLPRTNAVSRVYLEAAIVGEVSERLADLARAIATGASPRAIMSVAAPAIAVGHTSGADATLGLLIGSSGWGPEPLASAARDLVKRPGSVGRT